jgi:putative nucleotidyltransferase-like protein
MNVLKVAERRRHLALVLTRLAKVKIQVILLKGLSVANLYPDPRLRPVGDIDLYVCSEQFDDAKRVLRELNDERIFVPVDLEHEVNYWTGVSFGEVMKRCRTLDICGTTARVLGPEDNLRFLCLHFLQHGGGRALWLCDVAVAVENRPAGFDWNLCLGRQPAVSNWVASAISIADKLIGARIADTPVARQKNRLPHWIPKTLLSQWGSRVSGNMDGPGDPVPSPLGPVAFIRGLRQRWPDPISATVMVGGRLDNSPRILYQLRWGFQRAAKFYFPRIA